MSLLTNEFFIRDSRIVARELLGKKLTYQGKEAIIVETEAYTINDPGSHAYHKKTERNKIMFEEGGCLYIYLCYGVHELMNIVTDKKGVPSAVLIRAIQPMNFKARGNGPGLVTKALGINREQNGLKIGDELKISEGINDFKVVETTRIGLKEGSELPYRYYIKDNPHISRK